MKMSDFHKLSAVIVALSLLGCGPPRSSQATTPSPAAAPTMPSMHPAPPMPQTVGPAEGATSQPSYEVAIATVEANYKKGQRECEQGAEDTREACHKTLDAKHQTEREATLKDRGAMQ